MAQRRMFSNKITDTDTFLDMPASAQNLYFHLNMHADDDGFLGNAKTIRRMIGASEDDLKILVAKGFLLMFDDGVTVIRDWRIHNYIQKDRYHQTMYQEHKKQLTINHNHQYEFVSNPDTKGIQDGSNSDPKRIQSGSNVDPSRTQNGSNEKEVTKSKDEQTPSGQATEPMDPECIQDGSKMDPQVRVRLGKSKDRVTTTTDTKLNNATTVESGGNFQHTHEDVFNHWQGDWGFPNTYITQDLDEWIKGFGPDVIYYTIDYALSKNVTARKADPFMAEVIKNYRAKQVKTVDDAIRVNAEFDSRGNYYSRKPIRREVIPEFMKKDLESDHNQNGAPKVQDDYVMPDDSMDPMPK